MLLLLACTGTPGDTGDTAPSGAPVTTLEWLYGDVVAPADADIGGLLQVEHATDYYGAEPTFSASAWFWTGDATMDQPWSDPFDGLGDCGVWTDPPTWEGDTTALSAGTIFLDAGLATPAALPYTDDGYTSVYFQDIDWGPPAWGAAFAVTAVGDAIAGFDWDPGLALLDAPLVLTTPADAADGGEIALPPGALALAWSGVDPWSTVTIELSASGNQGVYCEVPDTGAFTIPAEHLDAIAHLGGRRSLYVTRERVRYEPLVTADGAAGRFARIVVSSRDRRTLQPE